MRVSYGGRHFEDAEAAGIIKPGETTLIEPTSGNYGLYQMRSQ